MNGKHSTEFASTFWKDQTVRIHHVDEMVVSYKTIKSSDVFHLRYDYLYDDIHKINSLCVSLCIIILLSHDWQSTLDGDKVLCILQPTIRPLI